MNKRAFSPDEIIFSSTTACNLHCEHCFVNRNPCKLDINQAVKFLQNSVQSGKINRLGFSGGEPFLYMDFLLALTKEALSLDIMFDQIMTNGDWWQTEEDLTSTLQSLYNAGYDGKIGLSWDKYHGQTTERMQTFIKTVQQIFGDESINIQTVGGESLPLSPARERSSATPSNGGSAPITPPVYRLPRTYPSEDPQAWKARRWFKEDYCEGPGNILYVHADGNIAPCCGFANENPALFIGRITDDFETIMKNASENVMVQRCFSEGLSHYRRHELKKELRKCGKKLPGKTSDICTFCDFVCKL
jgi:MoaA/NifB/PqqE/SkfB family radical SAM enzyme